MSLRLRIALAAGGAVALALIAGTVIAYFAIRSELRGQVDGALRDRVANLIRFAGGPGGGPDQGGAPPQPPPRTGSDSDHGLGLDIGPRFPARAPRAAFGGAAGYVQFVTADGKTVRPPDETDVLPVSAVAKRIAKSGSGQSLTDTHVDGRHLRVLTAGRPGGGAVQAARPLNEVDRELRKILLILIAVGVGGILVAGGLGLVVARAALGPIARFTRRTEAVTGNPDLSQRMEVEGRDELARLAQSFNTTLDALERSAEAQRHLIADASHELRTPIASLRANIQVLEEADRLPAEELAALRADIIDELDELTALVGDVVELARGGKPPGGLDDVRLDEVVASIAERAQRRGDNHVELRLDLEPTVVRGEPERIGRAIANLLDNARKWSPPEGVVDVTLAGGVLTVRDHGPGFAAEDLPHVFERFYRANAARGMPGSGLGLAIVRQSAEDGGGFADASNHADGGAVLRVGFGRASRPEDQEVVSESSETTS